MQSAEIPTGRFWKMSPRASSDNLCFYMAINQINKGSIRAVCETAREQNTVRAVSFNFHTPLPGHSRTRAFPGGKRACCDELRILMAEGYPIFNLKSAFPYLVDNSFPTPCHQCIVMENGKQSVCGRCIDVPGLCDQCGYFFAAEYSLLFRGNLRVAAEMLHTYLKYI